MYTQCPECLSVFSLGAQTLVQAHGYVVCGHCGAGFDSLATLSDQLPPEPFQEMPANEQALAPPRIELVVYRPRATQPEAASAALPALTSAPDDFSQLVFTPRFAREKRSKRGKHRERAPKRKRAPVVETRRWPWIVMCLLLFLALDGQLAWIGRDTLTRNPVTGSWLRSLCDTFDCRLPLVADPQQLQLIASNVEAHPNAAHALMISISLRNNAAFAQPWPVVTVTLSNAQGQRVAMRRLQPPEYLDDDTILKRGLAPGATTALLLEVEDPGNKAVAYEFDFE